MMAKKKREPEWDTESLRDINDRLINICCAVDEIINPIELDPDDPPPFEEPPLEEQFRDLRAAIDAYEALCQQRISELKPPAPSRPAAAPDRR